MIPGIGVQVVTPRGGAVAVSYLLRATFIADDQGFADDQVLDTEAEGVTDGQLTVVEKDGTLAIVSNKCAFTAQGTPVWGDLGFYSQAITRALGVGLLGTVRFDATTSFTRVAQWMDNGNVGTSNIVYEMYFRSTGPDISLLVWDGAGGLLENVVGPGWSAATDYQIAIILGGYDSNGVPWYSGEPAANYLYGAEFYIRGGAFTDWTKLWRTALGNIATLYAAFTSYSEAGTLNDFRVPDEDLKEVFQPTCLSTFTAPNGTSLDAITPEVGGGWTEQRGTWDIQGNRADIDAVEVGFPFALSTVTGMADCIIDVTTQWPGLCASGVIIRYSDNDNFWIVRAIRTKIQIMEQNGGVFTERASTGIVLGINTDYDLRGIAYGQVIDGFVDGGNKMSYGSAALNEAVTTCGLYGDLVAIQYDNFHISARTSAAYSILDAV